MNAEPQVARFGAFELGGAAFALPMDALREVIPCRALEKFPNPSPCVVGGINLRDVLVPVVDLRMLLNQPIDATEFPCVVIIAHEGKILGLLADAVNGIFSAPASAFHRLIVTDPVSAIVQGSVHWSGGNALVSVLSPQAISNLETLPMVDDPEPHRQSVDNIEEDVVISDASLPVMLVRCGRLPLAIDALAIHTTVSDVVVYPSPLAMGYCLGVMHYAGMSIPVVDLPALCGLGGQGCSQVGGQAFILSLPKGFVACFVSEVVDVVRIQANVLVNLVDFSLQFPRMFAGALPMTDLPEEVIKRTALSVNQYLLIDAKALHAHIDLVALSQTNTQVDQRKSVTQGNTVNEAAGGPRPMITYSLITETATPIEQVVEILAYSRDAEIFDAGTNLLGLIINRGRSIPVLCLSRLLGGPPCPQTPSTSVLVVAVGSQHIGFAISQLKSIETAVWEPGLPSTLNSHGMAAMGASSKLAQMGQGAEARMIPVVDLQNIAEQLCRSSDLPIHDSNGSDAQHAPVSDLATV